VARSVTLLVKPREAEAIELASSSGRTRLVLRGWFDEGVRQGEGVSVAELLGGRPQMVQQVQPMFVERSTTQPTTRPVGDQTLVQADPQPYEPPQTRKFVVEFIRGTKLTRGEFEVSVDPDGNEVIGTTKEIENP